MKILDENGLIKLVDLIKNKINSVGNLLENNYYTKGDVDDLLDEIQLGGGDSSSVDLSKYITRATYDSDDKKIIFYHNDTKVTDLDMSPLSVDNYVENATINDNELVLTLNKEGVKEEVKVPFVTEVGDIDLTNYYKKTETYSQEEIDEKFSNIELSDYAKTEYVDGELEKKLDTSAYETDKETFETKANAEATYATKTDISDMATETWVKGQNYLTEHQSLDEYAKSADVEKTYVKKVENNKLISLTIDEYNDLGTNIDNDAYYFIIDEDDSIFDKVVELENRLIEAENFITQFPEDNRTYGIINRYPKYLNIKELDDDPRD